jgi:hypothetical protein
MFSDTGWFYLPHCHTPIWYLPQGLSSHSAGTALAKPTMIQPGSYHQTFPQSSPLQGHTLSHCLITNILEYTSLGQLNSVLGCYSFDCKLPQHGHVTISSSAVLLYFVSECSLFLLHRLIYMSLQPFFRDSEGIPLDEAYSTFPGPVKCGHAT